MNRIAKLATVFCVCLTLYTSACSQAEVDYLKLGNEETAKGNYDKAIELYTQAIKINPNYADAYHNRGEAYQKKGDFKASIPDLSKVIELQPNSPDSLGDRCGAYSKLNEYDKAIADCNKAIELKPDMEALYFNRGLAYAQKGDNEQAIKDFTKSIELNPNDAVNHGQRANIYRQIGNFDAAIEDFSQAIALAKAEPRSAIYYFQRGLVFYVKGDIEKTANDFIKVLELDPYNTLVREVVSKTAPLQKHAVLKKKLAELK